MCDIQKGDIVLYDNIKYKIDNIKYEKDQYWLKMHSVRGKNNSMMYYVPVDLVKKIEDQNKTIKR